MLTVETDADAVEERLLSGGLASGCGGVLTGWGGLGSDRPWP